MPSVIRCLLSAAEAWRKRGVDDEGFAVGGQRLGVCNCSATSSNIAAINVVEIIENSQ